MNENRSRKPARPRPELACQDCGRGCFRLLVQMYHTRTDYVLKNVLIRPKTDPRQLLSFRSGANRGVWAGCGYSGLVSQRLASG